MSTGNRADDLGSTGRGLAIQASKPVRQRYWTQNLLPIRAGPLEDGKDGPWMACEGRKAYSRRARLENGEGAGQKGEKKEGAKGGTYQK